MRLAIPFVIRTPSVDFFLLEIQGLEFGFATRLAIPFLNRTPLVEISEI